MTLPDERYRSIQAARELLVDLTDPKVTPRLPRMLRLRAAHCLRHYPSDYDMDRLAAAAPDILQQRMEPLYRMIKQHELDSDHKNTP